VDRVFAVNGEDVTWIALRLDVILEHSASLFCLHCDKLVESHGLSHWTFINGLATHGAVDFAAFIQIFFILDSVSDLHHLTDWPRCIG